MESVRLASATRWTNDRYLRSAVVHRTFAMLKQLGRSGMRRRSCAAEQKRLEGSDAYSTVTFSRHRRRRFSRRTVCAGHLVFEPEGRGGKMTAATSSDLAERTPWPRVPFEALLGLVLDEVG